MLNQIGYEIPLKRLIFIIGIVAFSAYAVDQKTLKILQELKNKNYSVAVTLLEKEMDRTKDKSKRGYYSLLLNQMPTDIKMKKSRYEYAFIAGQWAKNIPRKQHLLLWIEAGDGFFKVGRLKKAGYCYKKALHYIQPEDTEQSYILHKQAWIYINQKKGAKAYTILRKALNAKAGPLKSLILSDMGKIWVESQYDKKKALLSALAEQINSLSLEEQSHLIKGMAKGLRRMAKPSLIPVVSTLSANKTLSSKILNDMLSHPALPVRSACQLIPWIESVKVRDLNKKLVFSVLNSCTRYWISQKKRLNRAKQIKRMVHLYTQFERRGLERWPLALSYQSLGWHSKACEESLYQLLEMETLSVHLKESRQFCEKAKASSPVMVQLALKLLSSSSLPAQYKSIEGAYESELLSFFKLKIFAPFLKPAILKAHKSWKGKDFLPVLLLSHINDYNKEELESFINRFSVKPLSSYYLNILVVRDDIVTEKNLNQWLPLSDIDSYAQAKPYMQAFLAGHLSEESKKALSTKLINSFLIKEKEKQEVAMFLTLYYLQSQQTVDIFKNWTQLSSAFTQKSLAVELFEKSLLDGGIICKNLRSVFNPTKAGIPSDKSPLIDFIYHCCKAVYPSAKPSWVIPRVPLILRSSSLARDFMFFLAIQRKTLKIEKSISRLEKNTSKMIMGLRKSISRYQKRKWHLEIVAQEAQALLARQMDLFEKELDRLSLSSPYGNKYKELKKIVQKWR